MTPSDQQALAIGTEAIRKLGEMYGFKLDPETIAFFGARVVEMVAGIGWRNAQAAGQAASDAIQNGEDAEALMRGGKK